MSIQSSVNALIGSIGALKKAHDFSIHQKAMQNMEEQKLAIRKQKIGLSEYEAKTKRKQVNLAVRKQREKERQDGTKTL